MEIASHWGKYYAVANIFSNSNFRFFLFFECMIMFFFLIKKQKGHQWSPADAQPRGA